MMLSENGWRNNMNKQQQRVELIKAWAYGAQIEVFDSATQEWRDLNGTGFHPELQYRIKNKENK